MKNQDIDVIARTLYGEARGEYKASGIAAFISIANVIVNRARASTKKYGLTYAEVCLKPRQFSCWNVGDPNRLLIQEETLEQNSLFNIAQTAAQKVIQGVWPDLTKGSNHYHARSCKPYWAREKYLMFSLGNHLFYKLD